jgi:hypothetical protein
VALIKRDTRRFIRQQYNWFRLRDEGIAWLDARASLFAAALEEIEGKFGVENEEAA